MYDATDMEHYSTHLYQDKAIQAIETHDFLESSMFMYMAFQVTPLPRTADITPRLFHDNRSTNPFFRV